MADVGCCDPFLGCLGGRPGRGSLLENRWIGSAVPHVSEEDLMKFFTAGRWLEDHLRLMALRPIEFKDLVEAAAQRDLMLGGIGDGPTGRLPWGRLDCEEDDIAFLRNLAEGHGFGAPLGDRIALAIRIVANLRGEQVSSQMTEALRTWLDTMQREEDAGDEDASLRTIFDILHRELPVVRE